jgi:hypothetical protein
MQFYAGCTRLCCLVKYFMYQGGGGGGEGGRGWGRGMRKGGGGEGVTAGNGFYPPPAFCVLMCTQCISFLFLLYWHFIFQIIQTVACIFSSNSSKKMTLLHHQDTELLTLSYSSKINGYISSEAFSVLEKKGRDMSLLEGNAAHPGRSERLMQILTLSYSSKINSYLYHQRISPPLKDNEAWIQLGQESPLMNKKGLIMVAPIRGIYLQLKINLQFVRENIFT